VSAHDGEGPPPPTIRPAVPSDRAEWLRIKALLLPSEATHEAEVDRYFAEAAPDTVALVLVRPRGGLGGFVEVGPRSYAEDCVSSPVAYVEAWYVDADLRRSGLGRALMEAAAAWARMAGYTEMGSDAVAENAESIAAHLAIGFEKTAELVTFRRGL
jgi:aminoglycoside 6'-N-acetyltransferase I